VPIVSAHFRSLFQSGVLARYALYRLLLLLLVIVETLCGSGQGSLERELSLLRAFGIFFEQYYNDVR